jgi:hypothetical protein
MLLSTSLFLFTALPALSLALPAAPGSKHNVYLVRCTLSDCSDWDCDPDDTTLTAGVFFRNGPIAEGSSSRIQKPTSLAPLTSSRTTWEGTKRTMRFGSDGTFTSNISAGAKTVAKGSIAGDATLGSEPFVCFKDGATKFAITYDYDEYTCTTDYWCPSIDTGDAEGAI